MLQGYFFPARGEPVLATVIFLQGFPGVEGDELICALLAQANLNVLTFNYRGTFRSQGNFSFSNAVSDIGATLSYLSQPGIQQEYHIDTGRLVLGGWSFGSGILPAGAAQHPQFSSLFTLSGRNFAEEARRIERDPAYARTVAGNLESIRSPHGPVNLVDDLLADLVANQDTFDILRLAPLLKDRRVLLVGAWDDEVSPIEDHLLPFYRLLVEHGAQNVSIQAFQDDHEFSASREQLVQLIVSWLSG